VHDYPTPQHDTAGIPELLIIFEQADKVARQQLIEEMEDRTVDALTKHLNLKKGVAVCPHLLNYIHMLC
jgi:hypothetical protein